ncbi:MAG: bifunctional 4-hydroxy-2-oxoglutarate aldolase/2-dehydro-3-deoxy-phosphogluconate aldolase [Rhodobiaceae bacterium]
MTDLSTALQACPIVPVLTISRLEDCAPLAQALANAGLRVLEITFRTDCAAEAIAALKKERPDLVIGAGTVLNQAHIDTAHQVGADFTVTPGVSPQLRDALKQAPMPVIPGAATIGEMMGLMEDGFTRQKFFPATIAGGVGALKAVGAPLAGLSFMPTGGINADNVSDFLALKNVFAVGGSWMIDAASVAEGNWAQVEAHAARAIEVGAAA